MYALVDCNNFYVSCERLFNPTLKGKPVVVLSNNDGCAIARSEEAKALGIVMGTPAFMIDELLKKHSVKVFSSNYTLYGDLSDRVMKTLGTFVPRMEMYSIDEAFLDMHNMDYTDLLKLGIDIKRTVQKNIGIPVCVGIAPTKTLAKMANRYAKKCRKEIGVHWAANQELVEEMLDFTEVGDIWGIGRQRALLLTRNGFKTALDLVKAPEEWIRKEMSVVGQRLLNELKGIPALQWEFEAPAVKGFDLIFREGYNYQKCGVIVQRLVPEGQVQGSLFDGARNKSIMKVMDKINFSLGKEIVRSASQGFEKKYRLRADHLSKRYTTNINEILKIKI